MLEYLIKKRVLSKMTIHIEELTFDTIIGLLDFERITPQKVIINLEASYDYSDNNFINYADIVKLIEKKIIDKEYKLLEEALLGLKNNIRREYPQVQTLYIKISKPNIIDNCRVSLSQNWHF